MVARVPPVGQGSSGSSAADNRIGYLRIENRLYRVTVKNATLASSPETLRKIHLIAHTQLQGISNATKIVIKASTTTIQQQTTQTERQNTEELKQPSRLTHHAYQTLDESNQTPITQELYTETYKQYQTPKTCSAVFQSLFRQQDQPPARPPSPPAVRQAASSPLEPLVQSGSLEEFSEGPASPSLSSAPEPQEGASRVVLPASAVDSSTAPSDLPLAASTDAPPAAQQKSSVEQSSRQEDTTTAPVPSLNPAVPQQPLTSPSGSQEKASLASAPPRSSTPAASMAGDAPASAPASEATAASAPVTTFSSLTEAQQQNLRTCKTAIDTALQGKGHERVLGFLRAIEAALKSASLLRGEEDAFMLRKIQFHLAYAEAFCKTGIISSDFMIDNLSKLANTLETKGIFSELSRLHDLALGVIGKYQEHYSRLILSYTDSRNPTLEQFRFENNCLIVTELLKKISSLKNTDPLKQLLFASLQSLFADELRTVQSTLPTLPSTQPHSDAATKRPRTTTYGADAFSDELDAPSTTNLGLDPTYGIPASHPLTAPQQVPIGRIEPSPPTDSTSSSSSAKPAAPATTTPEAPARSTFSHAKIEFQAQYDSVIRSLSEVIASTETPESGLTSPELELAIELIRYKFEELTGSNLPGTFQAKLTALSKLNSKLADEITKATTAINLMKLAKSLADLIIKSNIKSFALTNNLLKCQSAIQSYWGEHMRRMSDEATRPFAPVSSPSTQPLDDEETSSQSSTSSQSKPGASSLATPIPPSTSGSSSRSSSPLRSESPMPADSSGEVIESTDRAAMIPEFTAELLRKAEEIVKQLDDSSRASDDSRVTLMELTEYVKLVKELLETPSLTQTDQNNLRDLLQIFEELKKQYSSRIPLQLGESDEDNTHSQLEQIASSLAAIEIAERACEQTPNAFEDYSIAQQLQTALSQLTSGSSLRPTSETSGLAHRDFPYDSLRLINTVAAQIASAPSGAYSHLLSDLENRLSQLSLTIPSDDVAPAQPALVSSHQQCSAELESSVSLVKPVAARAFSGQSFFLDGELIARGISPLPLNVTHAIDRPIPQALTRFNAPQLQLTDGLEGRVQVVPSSRRTAFTKPNLNPAEHYKNTASLKAAELRNLNKPEYADIIEEYEEISRSTLTDTAALEKAYKSTLVKELRMKTSLRSFRPRPMLSPFLPASAESQPSASPPPQASPASSEGSRRPTRAASPNSLVPSPTHSESADAVIEVSPAASESLEAEAPPAAPESAHSSEPSSSVSSSRPSTPIEAQAVSEEKPAPASESEPREGSVRSSPTPSPVDTAAEAAAEPIASTGDEIQLESSSSSSSSAAATEMVQPTQVRTSSPEKPPRLNEETVLRILALAKTEVSELNDATMNSKYLTDLAIVEGTVKNRILELGLLSNRVQKNIPDYDTKKGLKRLITESQDRYRNLLGIITQKKAEIRQRLSEEQATRKAEAKAAQEQARQEAEAKEAQRATELAASQLAAARDDIVKNQQLLNELSRRLEDVIETGTMKLKDGSPLTYTQASKEDWNRILGKCTIGASRLQETLARLHRQVSQSSSPDPTALESQLDLINDYIGLLLYESKLKDISPLLELDSQLETYRDRLTRHGKTDLFRAWETRLSNYHAIIEFIKAYSEDEKFVNVFVDRTSVTLHSLDQRYRPTISAIVAQYGLDWLQNPSALKTRILKDFQAWKQEIDRLQRAIASTESAKTQAKRRAADLKDQLAILTLYEQYLAKKTRPPAPAPVASSSSSASASAAAPDVDINDPTVNAFISACQSKSLHTYIKETNETKTLTNLNHKKAQIRELLQKSDGKWITELTELAPLKSQIEKQFNKCETALKTPKITDEAKRDLKAKKDKLIIKLIILDNYIEYLKTPRRTR